MHYNTQNRNLAEGGFGIIEMVIIFCVVVALALGGWLLYKDHHKGTYGPAATSTSSTDSAHQSSSEAKATQSTPAASWYSYSSPDNNYTMRLPDGWSLAQNCDGPYAPLLLYSDSGSGGSLAIRQETKATVTDQCLGRDATPELSIQWYNLADSTSGGQQLLDSLSSEQQEPSFKTDSGLTAQKYYSHVSQPPQDVSEPEQGVYYNYIIKNGNSFVGVQYYIASGGTDYHANVEEAVRTIRLRG